MADLMTSFRGMADETGKVVLSRLSNDEELLDNQIFLQTTFREGGYEGYDLLVVDGTSAWEGSITEKYLDDQCESLKMDFNAYVKETTTALTKTSDTNNVFECVFQPCSVSLAKLVWKKVAAKNIKFTLGTVNLKKCAKSGEKLCSLLSQCIAHTQKLHTQISSLDTDNERLMQDRKNALTRLEKCVTAKDQLEKDLYSKFVLVLNSKKEKIRQLEEDHISQSINDNHEINASPIPSTSGIKTKRDIHQSTSHANNEISPVSDQSSAIFDQDTDDETTPAKKSKSKTHGLSAANRAGVLSDSSLNFGEEDDDDDTAQKVPVARRARKLPAAKKETPAKPALPRVSSNEKGDEAGARRSSLRKSGSGRSNKSSDNLDPDDLMDDF